MYDLNYKLKYRPEPIERLRRYDGLPPPMIGEPSEARAARDAKRRAEVLYELIIIEKKGLVPNDRRRGLWFHAE